MVFFFSTFDLLFEYDFLTLAIMKTFIHENANYEQMLKNVNVFMIVSVKKSYSKSKSKIEKKKTIKRDLE